MLLRRVPAAQAGLAICSESLQGCAGSHGTSALAHLWAPVCAQLLLVPEDRYRLPMGQALQQHQQVPGLSALAPVHRQMGELQQQVLSAAAELVALALQVRVSSSCSKQQPPPSDAA